MFILFSAYDVKLHAAAWLETTTSYRDSRAPLERKTVHIACLPHRMRRGCVVLSGSPTDPSAPLASGFPTITYFYCPGEPLVTFTDLIIGLHNYIE